jgi:hypothetical protein
MNYEILIGIVKLFLKAKQKTVIRDLQNKCWCKPTSNVDIKLLSKQKLVRNSLNHNL